jgi:hypothetical protein
VPSEDQLLDAVRAAETARTTAMASGNLSALAPLLHDEMRFGHTSGLADTKEAYLAKLRSGDLTYARMTSTETDAKAVDSVVLLWLLVEAEVITPTGRRSMKNACITVWTTDGGAPRMLAHQPTVLPRA